jgi:hypothetical protein
MNQMTKQEGIQGLNDCYCHGHRVRVDLVFAGFMLFDPIISRPHGWLPIGSPMTSQRIAAMVYNYSLRELGTATATPLWNAQPDSHRSTVMHEYPQKPVVVVRLQCT